MDNINDIKLSELLAYFMNRYLAKFACMLMGLLASTLLMAEELGEPVTFGNWYLRGNLQANIFIDTVHNDAGLSVARTEVFGDDGSNSPEQGSDNSEIPIALDAIGIVEDSRPIGLDVPELGFSLLGSRLSLGTEGDNYKAVFEFGLINPDDPYNLELHRLWFEYALASIGLGWSTFMDFKKDEKGANADGYSYFPDTVDYIGPPGFAYERQLAMRFKLSPTWYLGIEEAKDEAYLGYDNFNTHNDDFAGGTNNLVVTTSTDSFRTYEINRRLRTRHLLPNVIFTYYGTGKKENIFASFLLQTIKLDNNAPLLLDSDEGYKQLIADAEGTRGNAGVVRELNNQLGLNDDLSGGLETYNLAMNLGINGAMGRNDGNRYNLAYIYNGGRYLRDNPNPNHLVIKRDRECLANCNYQLVNIISHSYLMDFRFGQGMSLVLSGTVTDDTNGIELGGAATKQVHSTYATYKRDFRAIDGLTSNYEMGYSYRQTFNTRNNSAYPRIRFSYGIGYKF